MIDPYKYVNAIIKREAEKVDCAEYAQMLIDFYWSTEIPHKLRKAIKKNSKLKEIIEKLKHAQSIAAGVIQ